MRSRPNSLCRPVSRSRTAVPFLAALTLAGCAVGPEFVAPEAPPAATEGTYLEGHAPRDTASTAGLALGERQTLDFGREVTADWWRLFRCEALDRLIQQALMQSPTVATVQAALRQARENLAASTGSLEWPSVSAQVAASRQRASARDFSVFTAGVNVGYTFDLFGASRRQIEALEAGVDYQRYQLEAAYLTLTANLTVTAIREASLRAQRQATLDVLEAQERQLAVVERQLALGGVARSAFLALQTAIEQTRATLPPLEKSLAQNRHLLAVLAGRFPHEPGMPEFHLAAFSLPAQLPVSLPSALVRQRPDIRSSEALLHQASAQVGVSTANLYPQLSLSASFGASANQSDKLWTTPAQVWSWGSSLAAPLFNGGALQARRRAAEAGYDQALALYRQAVLTGFQNVADSLRAIEHDAAGLQTAASAERVARESFELARRQNELGAVSVLTLLDAERAYRQTRLALIQAQAARLTDTAVLFQALGGGWWQRQVLADRSTGPGAAPTPNSVP